MTNNSGTRDGRGIAALSETIAIALLLIHLYISCFPLFDGWGWRSTISDRILVAVLKTRIFDHVSLIKAIVLGFMTMAIAASPLRKQPDGKWPAHVLKLFFGVPLFFVIDAGKGTTFDCWFYIITMGLLMLWIMHSLSRIFRILALPWSRNDPFGIQRSGFPQEDRRLNSHLALSLRSNYMYKGKKKRGWVNIINPQRGVLILGTPGCGKSRFIIEPLIRQLIEKGVAMLLYDYKYDSLSKLAYAHYLVNRKQYPTDQTFFCINFNDLSRSHRCNVLAPLTMNHLSDAFGASRTILLSLNKTWINRQGDFFVESPINFMAALIWFLRRYKDGVYCTLPHVIELSKVSYDKLFVVLGSEEEIGIVIDPFVQAYTNETMEMLDGMITGAKVPLARLSSPEMYYVLNGNDFGLDINNPAAPKILCLGGDPSRAEALAPILSLYIDRINRICNHPGQHPCAIVCDEFATVRAPSVLTTLATGRSNRMVPILAVQDLAQLRTLYTRDEADWVMGVSGNLICGQVSGDTARMVSERFPRLLEQRDSVSVGSSDHSTSSHLQWEATVTPATVANLSSGEFMGIVGDDPENVLEKKAFHGRILREKADGVKGVELPVVREGDMGVVQAAFAQVRLDIANMVAEVIKGVINGPL